ncbi:MAG TPA: gliding motility lipoprotein GldH [Pelobium sp.]|nr:gliding motility lipoprotein GldH [Pelobium sp.]
MKFKKLLLLFSLLIWVLQACVNPNVKVDTYNAIPKQNWTYVNPVKATLNVTDSTQAYNIYVNFRHTADYKYANIWLRFHIIGPNQKDVPVRQEFQLAMPDGQWLGTGSGNLFTYQLIYKQNYKFASTGKYTLIVEQNMRDNPLKAVSDVGIYVELAK